MSERPWKHLSGEELRRKAKAADRALEGEIVRVRATDAAFKSALDLTLEFDDEIAARKNG